MKPVLYTREDYRDYLAMQQLAKVGTEVHCPVIMEHSGDIVLGLCDEKLIKPEGDGVVMCVQHQQEAHEAMHREV